MTPLLIALEFPVGHHILGFIGRHDDLHRAASDLAGASVAPLRLGYGFLPVTEKLAGDDEPAPFDHLGLTNRLGAWAEAQSRSFPLAYVETDYHGGVGGQAAVAWADGRVVFGPVRTTDLHEGGKFVPTPLLEGAINRAVRHLGVERGAARDEFDALGLGRHRTNEGWLADGAGFEVLTAGAMRQKYGLTAENRPTISLDPANVPPTLRHLIPLAERFGISDDLIRADFMRNASPTEVAELRRVVEEHNHLLNDWLAGPAADGPNFSAEYIAFSCMRMAADGC